MYMLIRYPVGIIVEGVVLAKGKNRMRVAVAGFPDTLELRRIGSEWFTQNRQPVEFEFLMPTPSSAMAVSGSTAACVEAACRLATT